MPEHKLIINGMEYEYEGYFNVKEILEHIKNYLTDKGYSYGEISPQTTVLPNGRSYFIDMRFNKGHKKTFSSTVKIRFYFNNIIKEYVQLDNVKVKLEKGIVKVIFDAWTHSYMQGHIYRELNPFRIFMRMFVKKYLYWFTTPEEKIEAEVSKNTKLAIKYVKTLFNKYPK